MPLSKAILIKVVFIRSDEGRCRAPEKCYRYQNKELLHPVDYQGQQSGESLTLANIHRPLT
jgi:hypothetical protein